MSFSGTRAASLRKRLSRLADLTHGSGRVVTEILNQQVLAAIAAADLVRRFDPEVVDPRRAHARMVSIEHRGDSLRSELVAELNRALVTPLDREDLNRLSRSIDDVLDNLRDFQREQIMYRAPTIGAFRQLTDLTADALRHLAAAVVAIPVSPSAVLHEALPAKKACNYIRRGYEASVAALFARSLTMEVLKQRELLRRLDIVGLRLGEAIDALSDAAVKRGA